MSKETQLSSLLGGQEKGWQIFIIEYEHLKQNIAKSSKNTETRDWKDVKRVSIADQMKRWRRPEEFPPTNADLNNKKVKTWAIYAL